jgi:cytochrome c551/c552
MTQKMLLGVGILIVGCGVLQLVPVTRGNPPVVSDIPTTPEVKAVLQRACYDCHSYETVWPSYARVAPVSWLIAHDVREGRNELHFSAWDQYTARQQATKRQESWEKIAAGIMPPWSSTILHPEARLSAADLALLRAWAHETTDVRHSLGNQ